MKGTALAFYRSVLRAVLGALDHALHRLPPRRLLWVGDFLGLCMYHGAPSKARTARTNLGLAYGGRLSASSRTVLVRRTFRNLGRGFAEVFRVDTLDARRAAAMLGPGDREALDEALARGRGLLVLTAHFGNWGLLSSAFAALGYPVNVLTKPVKDPVLDAFWRRRLSSTGVRLLTRENAMQKMTDCLRRNEAVAFVLDQNRPADQGVFVDFFGVPACTISALAVLAMVTRAPVVPLFLVRDEAEPWRHRVERGPTLSFEHPRDGSDAVRHNTQRYTGLIEEKVRSHPEQWIWLHKRWKTRPPGEPPLYGEGPAAH